MQRPSEPGPGPRHPLLRRLSWRLWQLPDRLSILIPTEATLFMGQDTRPSQRDRLQMRNARDEILFRPWRRAARIGSERTDPNAAGFESDSKPKLALSELTRWTSS